MAEPGDSGRGVAGPDGVAAPEAAVHRGPWGLWPTLGFSVIIAAAYTFVQVLLVAAVVLYQLHAMKNLNVEEFGQRLARNGLFWSVAVCAGAPIIIGLTLLFASAAKGIALRDYLALHRRTTRVIAAWCLLLLLFVTVTDVGFYLVRERTMPPLLVEVYRTAYFTPLLWFAFVIVAPVAEEVFFRGFFFQGLAYSRLGPAGAVILTAVFWALMHTQYDRYDTAGVFLCGLLLGYARWRSGSLYVPLAMHMVQNLAATG